MKTRKRDIIDELIVWLETEGLLEMEHEIGFRQELLYYMKPLVFIKLLDNYDVEEHQERDNKTATCNAIASWLGYEEDNREDIISRLCDFWKAYAVVNKELVIN